MDRQLVIIVQVFTQPNRDWIFTLPSCSLSRYLWVAIARESRCCWQVDYVETEEDRFRLGSIPLYINSDKVGDHMASYHDIHFRCEGRS